MLNTTEECNGKGNVLEIKAILAIKSVGARPERRWAGVDFQRLAPRAVGRVVS